MKQVEYYKNGNRTLRIKYEGIKKLLEKQDKEIERLNSKVEELMTLYTTEREVKEDYKSIIKEVREYISQLLEYKKEEYYKKISLDYVERILDVLEGI